MTWEWVTKANIDVWVRERDVDWLVNLVRHGNELAPEIREYLACVIGDLFNGKRKFPRRRPKKKGLPHDKDKIRKRVWEALKLQGHELPIELANGKSRLIRGQHSVKIAVATVAKELKYSETTVWNAWAGFDPLSYEYGREKHQHDAEMDLFYEYRHGVALGSLQREFGNKADFTEGEIEDRAQELDEDHWYVED